MTVNKHFVGNIFNEPELICLFLDGFKYCKLLN